ncbi:MAG TPA: FAD-dependent oxidoreductase [Dehalococcoidia bacterium]|nr:FAD-dependent oxidoreductase [Dehalococcoidia bacterium]
MSNSSRVLVVGAGPAGCAAAIRCAKAGLEVTLLERDPFPRDRPGETLHPGVEPLFRQLGVWDRVLGCGFPRHEGNWVHWGSPPRFEAFGSDTAGPWRGFQAWRAELDAILLDRAREVGVAVCQLCPAVQPIVEAAERVMGVATAGGLITTRFVIDAAGSRHWLGRHLGLIRQTWSPRLVARYGYVHGACPQRDEAPAIVADSNGWTWTARVRPGCYAWVRLSLNGAKLPGGWLPQEFCTLTPVGNIGAADVSWRLATPQARPGWFLVGDAAAVLDPASSHGVLKALMSGMMAAHLTVQVTRHSMEEAYAAQAYSDWLSRWFKHDVVRLGELYQVFERQ